MYRLVVLLIPTLLLAGQRYARLGELDGKTEIQIHAADPWQEGRRNVPLPQSARIQTAAGSHAEIELDDGSVARMTPETLLELSDYTRLSGGQRVTLVSLDHGMAYFTGQAGRQDALMLAVPGAQVTVERGARVRIEAAEPWSQIAVIEGKVRFASPSAELDLTEGEMARVDPANRAKFYLYREITPYDSDRWSEGRDKLLASAVSSIHVPDLHYGVQDLDTAGEWIDLEGFGTIWKPKIGDGWAPFRDGKWVWYDDLGFTWVGNDAWGWLPYHYGRWMRTAEVGWFWVPGHSTVFKPGEVYWLTGGKLAGWGPLAAGEDWSPGEPPQLYLNSTTTWASFAADTRTIDPAGFADRPKEPLAVTAFALSPPSPAFLTARLDAVRPPLRTGATRILPLISSVAYEDTVAQAPAPPPSPRPGAPPRPLPPIVVVTAPPDPPADIYYPVPVYTGTVVINPPGTSAAALTTQHKPATAASANTSPADPTTTKRAHPHPVEGDAGTLPRKAPADFRIHRKDGTDLPLRGFRGKVVLVACIHTACKHCVAYVQTLNAVQREYGPRGVQVLGVAFDDHAREQLPAFLRQNQTAFPLGWAEPAAVNSLVDPPVAGTYRLVPEIVLVDRRGNIQMQFEGESNFFQDPERNTRWALEQMLSPNHGQR
jgi:peroxiredoxin